MPWWGWVIIAAISVFVVAAVAVPMIRENPQKRALRAINKGKRG